MADAIAQGDEPSFDPVSNRLNWARRRVEELRAAIDAEPLESTKIEFRQIFDPTNSRIKLVVASVPETNPDWSYIASDAIQNYRTTLNYLVWQLAKWNLRHMEQTRDPKSQTQFPIASKPQEFNRGFVADLQPNHVTIIEFLQPYGEAFLARYPDSFFQQASREGMAKAHPFVTLQELSNTDKLRILQRTAAGAERLEFGPYVGVDCTITHTNVTPNVVLIPDNEWVTFDVVARGLQPTIQMADATTTAVAFEGGRPVMRTLAEIDAAVVQLLGFFEPVFKHEPHLTVVIK